MEHGSCDAMRGRKRERSAHMHMSDGARTESKDTNWAGEESDSNIPVHIGLRAVWRVAHDYQVDLWDVQPASCNVGRDQTLPPPARTPSDTAT